MPKNKKQIEWCKKTGAKIRAIRGDKTLAQFCVLYNTTRPLDVRITASGLSRYERGQIACPGAKLDKFVGMEKRGGKRRQ